MEFARSAERDLGRDSPTEVRRPPPPPPPAPVDDGAAAPRQIDTAIWQARLAEIEVDKTLMNRLVLDYLVIEGYKDAAEAFARESGVAPEVDLDTISDRMSIRAAVQRGDVEAAVARVNELDPQILNGNTQLAFHLRQQQLIEIIREGRVEDALAFAQQELAPAGEQNPAFLEELETTMALLAFENSAACPVGHLLEPTQRHKTARELNGAILASQAQQTGETPRACGALRRPAHLACPSPPRARRGSNGSLPAARACAALGRAEAPNGSAHAAAHTEKSRRQECRLPARGQPRERSARTGRRRCTQATSIPGASWRAAGDSRAPRERWRPRLGDGRESRGGLGCAAIRATTVMN